MRTADDDAIHYCDPPEKIEICLNCTNKKCDYGTCPLMDKKHKGVRSSARFDTKEFLRLHKMGWNDGEIAVALEVSSKIVQRYRAGLGLQANRRRAAKKCGTK